MRDFFGDEKYKKIVIAFCITLVLTVVTFVLIFSMLNKKASNSIDFGLLNVTSNQIVSNNNMIYPTSISRDKGINEVINQALNSIETENKILSQGRTEDKSLSTTANPEVLNTNKSTVTNVLDVNNVETSTNEVDSSNVTRELEFESPVNGEILVDYAKESLVYSETLDEWTTHLGIDIKADKTSIVLASERGVVESIKNDPRYGLTITINHNDEFKTVYSNLLSTEFVSEGDSVEKGQTIGTIGESASFEIADVPHLHFEMYKNGECVNPTEYLK